jgi:hypothetical protein
MKIAGTLRGSELVELRVRGCLAYLIKPTSNVDPQKRWVWDCLFSTRTVFAGPPPDEVVQKLTETIRKHCPEAKIEVTEKGFVAKSGTMMFTLHSKSKTGEVYPETYQQEGPNFKGFILRIEVLDGKYEGAAVIPQTLQGPYFPTFIDAPSVEKEKQHYEVRFSCGSRLDPDLKKGIFEVIPKTRFQPGAAPNDGPALPPALLKDSEGGRNW